MKKFFHWLFGYDCSCGGEWSKWLKYKKDVQIRFYSDLDKTYHYQERYCLNCGKIQQEEMEF